MPDHSKINMRTMRNLLLVCGLFLLISVAFAWAAPSSSRAKSEPVFDLLQHTDLGNHKNPLTEVPTEHALSQAHSMCVQKCMSTASAIPTGMGLDGVQSTCMEKCGFLKHQTLAQAVHSMDDARTNPAVRFRNFLRNRT
jgi:hypothetical protein